MVRVGSLVYTVDTLQKIYRQQHLWQVLYLTEEHLWISLLMQWWTWESGECHQFSSVTFTTLLKIWLPSFYKVMRINNNAWIDHYMQYRLQYAIVKSSLTPIGWHLSCIDPKLFSNPIKSSPLCPLDDVCVIGSRQQCGQPMQYKNSLTLIHFSPPTINPTL